MIEFERVLFAIDISMIIATRHSWGVKKTFCETYLPYVSFRIIVILKK